jgi:drug/metabolite transporter superfamily protein YnfA
MGFLQRYFSKFGIAGELLVFLWHRKLWWLIPMMVVLLLFGLLMIFAQSTAVAPFVYTLF